MKLVRRLFRDTLATAAAASVLLAGSVIFGAATAQDSKHRLGVYIVLAEGAKTTQRSLANDLSEQLAGELRQTGTLAGVESIESSDLKRKDHSHVSLGDSKLKAFLKKDGVQSYLSGEDITHMLVGVIEPPIGPEQVIRWRFVRLDYDNLDSSRIHDKDYYISKGRELSRKDVLPAVQTIIDYLIDENPSIASTRRVFTSCFVLTGDTENRVLRNYLFQLPHEIHSMISHNESRTDLRTRGYEVVRMNNQYLHKHCRGNESSDVELTDLVWQTHRAEYIISGFGLDMGREVQLHLQVEKPKLESTSYHSTHHEKVESYNSMGQQLAEHILTKWDKITDTLDGRP